MSRKALGRGLAALIPDGPPGQGAHRAFFICPIEQIRPCPGQPRRDFDSDHLDELAASLREHGVVQPLLVRRDRESPQQYVLIAGERRWRAAQRAGLHEVPVVIREANDLESFELALIENLQREDLNPIEEAEAYQRLLAEHGYTQDQLAQRVAKDRSTVANSLRLLKLPEPVRRALAEGSITAGHARALLGLNQEATIRRVFQQVLSRGLSVRQTEALIKAEKSVDPAAEVAPPAPRSANVDALEQRLTHSLRTRVRLVANKENKGRIEIHFGSLDELDRLLEVLVT